MPMFSPIPYDLGRPDLALDRRDKRYCPSGLTFSFLQCQLSRSLDHVLEWKDTTVIRMGTSMKVSNPTVRLLNPSALGVSSCSIYLNGQRPVRQLPGAGMLVSTLFPMELDGSRLT
jgi:hypothetical protein